MEGALAMEVLEVCLPPRLSTLIADEELFIIMTHEGAAWIIKVSGVVGCFAGHRHLRC